MHFRDHHNHNFQPQLLDVILHTLDVLSFSLHFLWGFLVYWFFLIFDFSLSLASKCSLRNMEKKTPHAKISRSDYSNHPKLLYGTLLFLGHCPREFSRKPDRPKSIVFPTLFRGFSCWKFFRDSHQPCRHRQPNEHSPTSPASPADIDSHQPCRHRQCKFVWFSLESRVKYQIKHGRGFYG